MINCDSDKQYSVNLPEEKRNFDLILNIQKKDYDAVRLAIKKGADIYLREPKKSDENILNIITETKCVIQKNGKNEPQYTVYSDYDYLEYWTPLMFACEKGCVKIVELLINKGANVNDITENGNTALMIASAHGYEKIVSLLIRNGADVDKENKFGQFAYSFATIQRNEKIIKLFIEHSHNIEILKKILWLAADLGYLNIVNLILSKKINNKHKETALVCAALMGHTEIVLNIAQNLEYNISSKTKEEVMYDAVDNGHNDIIELFMQLNMISNRLLEKVFMHAVYNNGIYNTTEAIKFFLEHNISNKTINEAIRITEEKGDIDSATLLLNKISNFPFLMAVHQNKSNLVKSFIENHIDIETKDYNGNTALILAASKGNVEITKSLLDHNANVNVREKEFGCTPLILAAKNGHYEIVSLLINHEPSIYYYSIRENVHINDEDFNGWNALDWAQKKKHQKIAMLLRKRGATRSFENLIQGMLLLICFFCLVYQSWITAVSVLILFFCLYIHWQI